MLRKQWFKGEAPWCWLDPGVNWAPVDQASQVPRHCWHPVYLLDLHQHFQFLFFFASQYNSSYIHNGKSCICSTTSLAFAQRQVLHLLNGKRVISLAAAKANFSGFSCCGVVPIIDWTSTLHDESINFIILSDFEFSFARKQGLSGATDFRPSVVFHSSTLA